jgi:hypothetical protein
MDSKRIYILLGIVFLIGTFLRLQNLGIPPLWIDEALFAGWVAGWPPQEFIPVFIAKLLPNTEFFLRLPFALCGSLTILAFYRVTGGGWKSLYGSALVAVFPIFVFWSRVARPYVFVGLFITLGWRWWGCYLVAILTNPIALLGLNLLKLKQRKFWFIYGGLGIMTLCVYFFRPDVHAFGDFIDIKFLFTEKRFWYVPLLTLLLYCCSVIPDKYFSPNSPKDLRST